MGQYEIMVLLRNYEEYVELLPQSTKELRQIVKELKKELDLRKIKYDTEGE